MGEQETDRVLYSGSLNIKDVSRLSLKYIYVTELGEAGSWQGVVATAAGPGPDGSWNHSPAYNGWSITLPV